MLLSAQIIVEVAKNPQELKKVEQAKILSIIWRSLENQAIRDLPKNLEELKKIEELKALHLCGSGES